MLLSVFNLNNTNNPIDVAHDIESVKLKQLDVSNDTMMNIILSDWNLNYSTATENASHSLIMSHYKNGRIIKIVTYSGPLVDNDYYYNGYIIWNERIIYSIIMHPKYDKRRKNISINTEKKNSSDIINITYYYIIDDIYAKYDHNVGWIWSDGKPDE